MRRSKVGAGGWTIISQGARQLSPTHSVFLHVQIRMIFSQRLTSAHRSAWKLYMHAESGVCVSGRFVGRHDTAFRVVIVSSSSVSRGGDRRTHAGTENIRGVVIAGVTIVTRLRMRGSHSERTDYFRLLACPPPGHGCREDVGPARCHRERIPACADDQHARSLGTVSLDETGLGPADFSVVEMSGGCVICLRAWCTWRC
jgi:hypothetical protein